MAVFWWTGRGYLTPVILMAVLFLFGIILQAGRPVVQDTPWFWGIGFIAAGAANWVVGRRQNARKLAAVRSVRFRDRLVYRARNKFMSLPLETWSIPLVLAGTAAIVYGIATR